MKDIQGVIFDLDGTLTNSMEVWETVDIMLLERYGFSPDKQYRETIGKLAFWEGVDYILQRYPIAKTAEELGEELYEMAYDQYALHLPLKDGVKELLRQYQNKGLQMVMATSSIRQMCEAFLDRHGIRQYFQHILFSDELKTNKTTPDIYLEAAKIMNLPPENCLVFEDMLFAAESAKAAGMQVVGVYDIYSKAQQQQMSKLCDRFIYSFREML